MTGVGMTLPQLHRRECTVDGRVVRLTANPHDLVALLLVSHPEHWVAVVTLIEALWPNPDLEPDWAVNCVHVMVVRLRRLGVPIVARRGRCGGLRIPAECRVGAEPHRLAA